MFISGENTYGSRDVIELHVIDTIITTSNLCLIGSRLMAMHSGGDNSFKANQVFMLASHS